MYNMEKLKHEILQWIKTYFDENGKEAMAIIGISGGKDSSIVANLCVEALGRDRVFGVLMPQNVQSDMDVSLALVKYLNIDYTIINIGDTADVLSNALFQAFNKENEQARINTPARIRMAVLYAVAGYKNGRVANTCNLSEDWVGYSTKFGDHAGDFSPLSKLTVTEVKALGKAIGLPDQFIEKVPVDGLSNKTDEENLGFSYDVLDQYIRENVCEDNEIKNKIDLLHKNNLHKMLPMPVFPFNYKD